MADMMADGFALRAISILPAISSFGGSDRSGCQVKRTSSSGRWDVCCMLNEMHRSHLNKTTVSNIGSRYIIVMGGHFFIMEWSCLSLT